MACSGAHCSGHCYVDTCATNVTANGVWDYTKNGEDVAGGGGNYYPYTCPANSSNPFPSGSGSKIYDENVETLRRAIDDERLRRGYSTYSWTPNTLVGYDENPVTDYNALVSIGSINDSTNGTLSDGTYNNGGAGYGVSAGYGDNATVSVTISGGTVTGLSVISGGSGYNVGEAVIVIENTDFSTLDTGYIIGTVTSITNEVSLIFGQNSNVNEAIQELKDAINQLASGYVVFNVGDATPVRYTHLNELRTKINTLRSECLCYGNCATKSVCSCYNDCGCNY